MIDDLVEEKLDRVTRFERRITQKVLQLILLAEDRKIYAKRGYSNRDLFNSITFGTATVLKKFKKTGAKFEKSLVFIRAHVEPSFK